MKSLFKSVVIGILAGSAWVGQAVAKPDEVSEAEVRNCRFLGTVAGSSGLGKNLGWQPLAKSSAESKAGRLGATHIVFTDLRSIGSFNGEARGRAYDCP